MVANGTLDQVLTSSGGTSAPTWTTLVSANVVSKTAAYTITSSDSIVLVSGGTFYITMPDATLTSSQNKVFTVKKTDASLTNVISINTTSSQSINWGTTSYISVPLNTQGEDWSLVSDGSNWQVLDHNARTQPVAYTPSFLGWNSVSAVSFYSWREGNRLWFTGQFTGGTANGANASFTLGFNGVNNPGIDIDSNIINSTSGGMRSTGMQFASDNTAGSYGTNMMQPFTSTREIFFTIGGQSTVNSGGTLGTGTRLYLGIGSAPINGWLD